MCRYWHLFKNILMTWCLDRKLILRSTFVYFLSHLFVAVAIVVNRFFSQNPLRARHFASRVFILFLIFFCRVSMVWQREMMRFVMKYRALNSRRNDVKT